MVSMEQYRKMLEDMNAKKRGGKNLPPLITDLNTLTGGGVYNGIDAGVGEVDPNINLSGVWQSPNVAITSSSISSRLLNQASTSINSVGSSSSQVSNANVPYDRLLEFDDLDGVLGLKPVSSQVRNRMMKYLPNDSDVRDIVKGLVLPQVSDGMDRVFISLNGNNKVLMHTGDRSLFVPNSPVANEIEQVLKDVSDDSYRVDRTVGNAGVWFKVDKEQFETLADKILQQHLMSTKINSKHDSMFEHTVIEFDADEYANVPNLKEHAEQLADGTTMRTSHERVVLMPNERDGWDIGLYDSMLESAISINVVSNGVSVVYNMRHFQALHAGLFTGFRNLTMSDYGKYTLVNQNANVLQYLYDGQGTRSGNVILAGHIARLIYQRGTGVSDFRNNDDRMYGVHRITSCII